MLNFGASKPRVKGGRAPGAPPGSAPAYCFTSQIVSDKNIFISLEQHHLLIFDSRREGRLHILLR